MRMPRHLATLLLVALTLTPLGLRPQPATARAAPDDPPAISQTPLPDYPEQEAPGETRNNEPESAELISPRTPPSWSRVVSGTIGTSADVDYFRVQVPGPGSKIKITLDGLPADYDLVLGGGIDPSLGIDKFETGLEGVTQVGSSINAIGSSINAIGSSINAIGSSINAIGSSINAIGSSINAISARAGTGGEAIDTVLWLPGTYYVVVTTSNGQYSTSPYRLTVELTGSGLTQPPPAPEVSLNLYPLSLPGGSAANITTLYIYNTWRMEGLYGAGAQSSIGAIYSSLGTLTASGIQVWGNAPQEYGVAINLANLTAVVSGTQTIADIYQRWDGDKANPLAANYVAGLIDNVIEAATTDGVSGPGTTRAEADFYVGDTFYSPLTFPNLRNVVLVGGDEVLPYYRVPDLTTVANEADYAAYLASLDASGIIDPNSAQGAALRYRMLLTDNIYGAGRPYRFYGFPFFLPRLAVGRLVENPDQIARYLSYYADNIPSAFQIDASAYGQPNPPLRRAFVSGYDFLTDQAARVGQILRATTLQSDEISYLNSDTWRRADLEQSWFDGGLADFPEPANGFISDTARIDLSSVNAHFDHWQLLPATHSATNPATNFPAQRILSPAYPAAAQFPQLYFGGTLGYSVGCHSGYSAYNGAIVPTLPAADLATYQADFPEALNSHGGNWVGNTGYGYGTADGIDYSERLAVLYTQELARNVAPSEVYIGASIGEALVSAKQRYVRNASSLSAYDYKVLNVMNLYGMPFARVWVSDPLDPPAEDPGGQSAPPVELGAPKEPISTTGRLTRLITFTIDLDPSDYRTIARTGSQVLQLDENDFRVEDEFQLLDQREPQRVRVFENSQVGAPTLPTFAYDISTMNNDFSERLKVVDVVFLEGSYGAKAGFDPQITQVATETLELTPLVSRQDEPDFRAGAGVWYPDKFFGFSTVGEGDQQRDQLTSFAAQLRADADGRTGLLRPYTRMVFEVTYDDPAVNNDTTTALRADTEAPVIQSVEVKPAGAGVKLAQNDQTKIVVKVSDLGGASADLEVSAIYVLNGDTWAPVAFVEETPGVYVATLPVKPALARFIVRATDAAGNSSYYTGKGALTSRIMVALPLIAR